MVLTLSEKLASGWFWRVPAALDSVQPPLTDELVRAAEAQLGVKLPVAYLTLLRRQNGGLLRATWPASDFRMLRGIGPLASSITQARASWHPADAAQPGWSPDKAGLLLPFDGREHWSLCFDYRKHGPTAEPRVTFVDSECHEEELLAQNFTAFLSGLIDEHAKSTRIYGDVSAEQVARSLAQQLGAPAPRVDHGSSGCTRWRIALKGDHQWCWVSPNRVAAGYRRAEQDGPLVLSAEVALQLPEDPACVALVSSTEDSRALVFRGIQALGLSLEVAQV